MGLLRSSALLWMLAAALSTSARADAVPTLTLEAPASILRTDTLVIRAKVTFPAPCPADPAPTGGTVTLHGGPVDITYRLGAGILRTCSGSTYTDETDFYPPTSSAGARTFTADYSGTSGFAAASAAPVTVTAVPYLSGAGARGTVKFTSGGSVSYGYCEAHDVAFDAAPPPSAPPGLTFPDGSVRYAFTGCTYSCGFLCESNAPTFPSDIVQLELPQPPAPGSKVWIYAPGGGIDTPVWRKVEPRIDGNTVSFVIAGTGSELRGVFAVASGDGNRNDLQDLWWGGPQENGWGVGISQIGDRMFLGLYVYGVFTTAGSPVWLVMPGGTWDASHTSFSGSVYVPQNPNSSYAGYSSRNLSIGSPAMNGKITFRGTSSADLELTPLSPYGYPGPIHKSLVRQPFGTSPESGPFAGLWWGGAEQNGWGISLAQQGDTLFGVWYTYDKAGGISANTWFVMPGGKWTSRSTFGGTYTGTLYRTKGAQWSAPTYDPSQLVVTPAGSLTLTFYTSDIARMDWTVDGVRGTNYYLYKQPF